MSDKKEPKRLVTNADGLKDFPPETDGTAQAGPGVVASTATGSSGPVVQVGEVAAPRVELSESLVPDAAAPTYTGLLKLGGTVLAVDDWDTEAGELAQYEAREKAMVEEVERLNNLLAGELPDKERKKTGEAFNEAVKRRADFLEEVLRLKIKGTYEPKVGVAYALPKDAPLPIRVLPQRRTFALALSSRASIGQSELDFLAPR